MEGEVVLYIVKLSTVKHTGAIYSAKLTKVHDSLFFFFLKRWVFLLESMLRCVCVCVCVDLTN